MNWRTIPLFVSSTFQDMHAERDHLKEHIFPILEERLLKRNCQLEIIDLRWGVFTDNNKEAIEKELYVLSVCMNELEKSRPYFLGILGNRYGWVPPKQLSVEIMHEFGINIDPEGRSITELEILSGSLEAPIKMKPLFFFRDETVIHLIPEKKRVAYLDHGLAPSKDHKKLMDLKERLQQSYPDKIYTYKATWDEKVSQLSGLQAFGDMVLENLWTELDEDTKNFKDQTENPIQEDNMLVMSRIAQQVQNSVKRQGIVESLYSKLLSDTPGHLIISGETGSGKSTIISQLVFEIKEKKEILPLVHIGGLGSRGKSLDDMLIRFIELLKLEVKTDLPPADAIDVEKLDDIFMQLLHEVGKTKNIAIIIDEIHLLEKTERSRYLIWVKGAPPDNCHIVLSGKPCDQFDILRSKPASIEFEIPDIQEDEARLLILNICQKYHRGLSNELLEALLERRNEEAKYLYSNPLWLTLATEQINLVRFEDFLKAKDLDSSDPEKAIIAMLKAIILEFPENNREMYDYILNHLEKVYGKDKISLLSSLLTIARQGWRHIDIKVISEKSGVKLTDLDISRLILAFRGHISSSSEDGKMFLISDALKSSMRNRYLKNIQHEKNIHSLVANYLFKLPENEPLKSTELMYHFIRGGQFTEAKNYFNSSLSDKEYQGAAKAIAEQVLFYGTEGTDEDLGVNNLLKDFLTADAIEEWDTYQFLIEMITSVYDILKNKIPLKAKEYILSNCLELLQDLVKKGFESEYLNNRIVAGQQQLTEIKSSLGNIGDETVFYSNNLEKFKKEYEDNPNDVNTQRNYALTLFKKGSLTIEEGLADEALDDFKLAYQITIETTKLEPNNPLHQIGISEILSQMATIYKMADDENNARQALEVAHDSVMAAFELDTSSVEITKSIGRSITMLGDLEEWAGNYQQAYDHFYQAFKIRYELAHNHPDNVIGMHDLAISNYRLGYLLKKTGNTEDAVAYAQEAIKLFSLISQSDLDNFYWSNDKIKAETLLNELQPKAIDVYSHDIAYKEFKTKMEQYKYHFIVGIYDWSSNPKNDAEHIQQVLDDLEEKLKIDKSNPAIYADLSIVLTKLAQAYEFMGLLEQALALVNKALRILESLKEKDSDCLMFLEMAGEMSFRKGWILYRMKKREDAAVFAKIALDIYNKLYDSDEDNEDYEIYLEEAEDLWDIFNRKTK